MVELTEHVWDEPINKSPFDLPSGWQGGGVVNTGGNIFSRIWEHPQTNVKVIYNIEDPVVGDRIQIPICDECVDAYDKVQAQYLRERND